METVKKSLSELWVEAGVKGAVDVGDRVWCDACGEDWTGRPEPGGFLVQSKAICPTCAPGYLLGLKRADETDLIREFCPPDQSYWKWCVGLRGGNNTIKVLKPTSLEELQRMMGQ